MTRLVEPSRALRISVTRSTGMMIWPKNSSSPSIFTRRSIASLIDSSRPLCTLTTYQRLLLGAASAAGSEASAGASGAAAGAESPPSAAAGSGDSCFASSAVAASPCGDSPAGGAGGVPAEGSGVSRSSGMADVFIATLRGVAERSPERPVAVGRLLVLLVDLQHVDHLGAAQRGPDGVGSEQEKRHEHHGHEHDDRVLHEVLA